MTPDPIGLEGGINLFAYVRGNPLRWGDPLGLVDETTLAHLYQMLSKTGRHQKFGVTVDPLGRYSKAELAGGRLKLLTEGEPKEIFALERELHKYLPLGPKEKQCQYKTMQERMGIKGKTAGEISLWRPGFGKVLGVFGILSDLLRTYEAAKIAEQTGKNVWQVQLEMMGYSFDYDGGEI